MTRTLSDFLSKAERRFAISNSETPYGDWISQNTTLRGRQFSMDGFPFQREIADDMHENMVVKKCSQVGLTEVQIRKLLAFAKRNKGVNAIYTLPDEKFFKKVSQMRLKPCLEENPVFSSTAGEKPVRNQSIMQIGSSFVMITAADENAATSTPGDYLVHDEVDLSDSAMLALFMSRLQNSDYKIRHRFSTPTFLGFGIDAAYDDTDQREYLAKCGRCNHWQAPDFTRDFVHIPGLPDEVECLSHIDSILLPKLDLTAAKVVCEKCHAPLDLGDPKRHWVATRPSMSKTAHGYHIRPFTTTKLPISYIIGQLIEYRKQNYIRGWWNTTIGKPYTDGNIRLDEQDVMRCFTTLRRRPEIDPTTPCWIGVDMGLTCHLTMLTGDRGDLEVALWEAVPAEEIADRVGALCRQYNVVAGACDRHPYTPTAVAIYEASGSKVMPTEYRGNMEVNIVYDEEKKPAYAQAERTAFLDAVIGDVRRGHIRFSGYGTDERRNEIVSHFRAAVRDEKPDTPARYVKLSNDDHWLHSVGFARFSIRLASALRPAGRVETRSMTVAMGVQYQQTPSGLLTPEPLPFTGGLL